MQIKLLRLLLIALIFFLPPKAPADDKMRPKIAVVNVENISGRESEVMTRHPSIQPSAIPLFGRDARGVNIFGLKRPLDRYQEITRNCLEAVFVGWPEIQVIDRTREELIEAELTRDRILGGDRSRTERPLQRTAPNFLVLGTLQNVWRESAEAFTYGEARGLEQTWAEIHIRALRVPTGEVAFETITTGSYEAITTAFSQSSHSDVTAEAIKRALRSLSTNPEFKKAFLERVTGTGGAAQDLKDEIEVSFRSSPEGAQVEIDGIYAGETPLTKTYQRNGKHRVRLLKPSFEPWEAQIRIEPKLSVHGTLTKKEERGLK